MTVPPKPPCHPCRDAIFPHDPGDAVASAGNAVLLQGLVHSRIAVTLLAGLMHLDDLPEQLSIVDVTLALPAFHPGIVSRPRHTQLPAHHRNRTLLGMLLDEPEGLYFFPGKILSAFFSTAFSSLTCFNSFSNFLIFFSASNNLSRERAS